MIHWSVALFVAFWLLLFSVTMLVFAVALEVFLVLRLLSSLNNWERFVGSVGWGLVLGPFAYLFGSGAYKLMVDVYTGFVGRFL